MLENFAQNDENTPPTGQTKSSVSYSRLLWIRVVKPILRPFVRCMRAILKLLAQVHLVIRRKVAYRYIDMRDRMKYGSRDLLAPQAALRDSVHGSTDIESFRATGCQCAQDIEIALSCVNRPLTSFSNVLDFGCGCGRTLAWLFEKSPATRFHGVDIDAAAIRWCQQHLTRGTFVCNTYLPPLQYADDEFDLCYAISVFTHINEDFQFRWLKELNRVVRPGGLAIISVHGEHCWKNRPPEQLAEIQSKGFLFASYSGWESKFPKWYQTAYHSQAYVESRFADYFEVLLYLPQGIDNFQDAVVLRRR